MQNNSIDANFINEWKDYYDEDDIGGDYTDYIDICRKVSDELSSGMITKDTFAKILDWKSPRIKGKVRDDFEYYKDGIKRALEAPMNQKLSILVKLDGIGVPTASTILHFMYPSDFPIMDIRVAETLCDFGYLKKDTRSIKNYEPFYEAIHDISLKAGCTLREVDMAIFAYHKIILRPKGFKCKQTE